MSSAIRTNPSSYVFTLSAGQTLSIPQNARRSALIIRNDATGATDVTWSFGGGAGVSIPAGEVIGMAFTFTCAIEILATKTITVSVITDELSANMVVTP